MREVSKHVKGLDTPDYTSKAWRVAKIGIKIDSSIMKEDVIVIAADSSGIKVANMGEWLRKKWHVSGFKMHTVVDMESKENVVMSITKLVHDGKKMTPLIRSVEER